MEKIKNAFPQRKKIRLAPHNYNVPGAYFVTICTEDRKPCLWDNSLDLQKVAFQSVGANCVRPQGLPLSKIGVIVNEELEKWHASYAAVALPISVIMPNHLHIMITIVADEDGRTQFAPTISRMVKQFKGAVTKRVGASIWQKSFYDHVIRSQGDYDACVKYICENPMKWHLDELYTAE